jgi:DNA-binding MarR family transcriptional regulator
MADITTRSRFADVGAPEENAAAQPLWPSSGALGPRAHRIIELMYFAYRDFTADADEILAELGFGRAHHRALYFIGRYPGIRVADLLDILKITKQSLARVLRELRERGFLEQQPGRTDRRERLLFLTPEGSQLAYHLAERQARRIVSALDQAGVGSSDAVEQFLLHIIRSESRDDITRLMADGQPLAGGREDSDEHERNRTRRTAGTAG